MAFPIYFPWPVFMFQIRLCVYYSLWILIQTKHNKLDFKSHRNSSTLNDSRANWVWLQHITVILKVLRRDISLASQFCGPFDRNTTTKTKNKCVWVQNLTNWNITGIGMNSMFFLSAWKFDGQCCHGRGRRWLPRICWTSYTTQPQVSSSRAHEFIASTCDVTKHVSNVNLLLLIQSQPQSHPRLLANHWPRSRRDPAPLIFFLIWTKCLRFWKTRDYFQVAFSLWVPLCLLLSNFTLFCLFTCLCSLGTFFCTRSKVATSMYIYHSLPQYCQLRKITVLIALFSFS